MLSGRGSALETTRQSNISHGAILAGPSHSKTRTKTRPRPLMKTLQCYFAKVVPFNALKRQRSNIADRRTGRAFDELAQLINRGFMAAAITNAQHLGIDATALQQATPILTPRGRAVPATLQPVQLQHQIPHDAMIDIIPHPRLRHNVLGAIASQQLNAAEFSSCLRASGALESMQGHWQRGGLVVWSLPELASSWELSETFVRRFPYLLQGCEDLLASTNSWRSRRGERLFPYSLGR